jgi:hypothetical protein
MTIDATLTVDANSNVILSRAYNGTILLSSANITATTSLTPQHLNMTNYAALSSVYTRVDTLVYSTDCTLPYAAYVIAANLYSYGTSTAFNMIQFTHFASFNNNDNLNLNIALVGNSTIEINNCNSFLSLTVDYIKSSTIIINSPPPYTTYISPLGYVPAYAISFPPTNLIIRNNTRVTLVSGYVNLVLDEGALLNATGSVGSTSPYYALGIAGIDQTGSSATISSATSVYLYMNGTLQTPIFLASAYMYVYVYGTVAMFSPYANAPYSCPIYGHGSTTATIYLYGILSCPGTLYLHALKMYNGTAVVGGLFTTYLEIYSAPAYISANFTTVLTAQFNAGPLFINGDYDMPGGNIYFSTNGYAHLPAVYMEVNGKITIKSAQIQANLMSPTLESTNLVVFAKTATNDSAFAIEATFANVYNSANKTHPIVVHVYPTNITLEYVNGNWELNPSILEQYKYVISGAALLGFIAGSMALCVLYRKHKRQYSQYSTLYAYPSINSQHPPTQSSSA